MDTGRSQSQVPHAVGWSIREARTDDIPQLCTMLEQLRKETVWGNVPISLDSNSAVRVSYYNHAVKVLVQRLNNGWHKILVADTGRQLIGLCAGQIMTNDFIPTVPYLWEWAWWVHPNHRREPIGKMLLDTLTAWAKGRGAQARFWGSPQKRSRTRNTELMMFEYWGPAYG